MPGPELIRAAFRETSLLELLGEALNGKSLTVVGIEHGHQLRNLKHFLKLRTQVGQLQRGALRASAVKRGHERTETGAVNVANVREVQHDLFLPRSQQAFHFLAKRVALFA